MNRAWKPLLKMMFILPLLLLTGRMATAQYVATLTMHSETGDWVGAGKDYFFTEQDGSFAVNGSDQTGDGIGDTVSVSFAEPGFGEWWNLEFSTYKIPGNLAPGTYNNAEREPFESTGHAGLSVDGDGRGCNTLTGSFTITEITFNLSDSSKPRILRLLASFEQHCEGGAPTLVGTIDYTYTGDLGAPTTTMSLNGPGGKSPWYTGPVTVALNASDPDGSSDVAATYYSLDGGNSQTYSGPFTLSSAGIHTLTFHSVDSRDNREDPVTQSIYIDDAAPLISGNASVQMLKVHPKPVAQVTVFGSVSDLVSGVDPSSVSYSVQDELGKLQPGGSISLSFGGSFSFALLLDGPKGGKDKDGRQYQVIIHASDKAGNSFQLPIPVTVPRS